MRWRSKRDNRRDTIFIPNPSLTFEVPASKKAFVVGWRFYAQGQRTGKRKAEKVIPTIWRPTSNAFEYRLVGRTDISKNFKGKLYNKWLEDDDSFEVRHCIVRKTHKPNYSQISSFVKIMTIGQTDECVCLTTDDFVRKLSLSLEDRVS